MKPTEPYLSAELGVAVSPAPTFPAVLDACCGGRMFWWNKENTDALFMDCREVEKGAFQNNWNPGWCVKPDEIADFRDMPFPAEPLFGDFTGKTGSTIWVTYLKPPNGLVTGCRRQSG